MRSLKELDNSFEHVWINILMARVMFQGKSRFDLAMEFTQKAMTIAKEIRFNHFWVAFCELGFGVIHLAIGELDISLKFHMKSLAIYKEIKNKWFIAMTLLNIGAIYFNLGDYELALKYTEESLLYYEDQQTADFSLYNIVELALEKGDIKLAQKYFNQLEQLYNQKKDVNIALTYQVSKALMLSRSTRIRDRAKAEELLKQIIETEGIWVNRVDALVYLCDLL
ncbi:MAG: tol-pal system YbgF family protein, partial [Candidatus Hermodarchaeota archaeon]